MNWDYVPFNKNKAIGKLEFNFKSPTSLLINIYRKRVLI